MVEYNGKVYAIPEGAIVLQNCWCGYSYLCFQGPNVHEPSVERAMSRDKAKYPDPNRFDPSRHLTPKGALAESSVTELAFGVGIRQCPGNEFALRSLYVFVATMLWGFDITAPRDPNTGKPMVPDDMAFGEDPILPEPPPFAAIFTPRDQQRAEAILKHHSELQESVGRKLKQWTATKA